MNKIEDKRQVFNEFFQKPFIDELSENELKSRRNLLIISSVYIFIIWFDLNVSGTEISGLKIENLTQSVIDSALFFITVYNTVHFLWLIHGRWAEWKIRLTGTKKLDPPYNELLDYSDNIRQSTLYYWWYNQAPTVPRLSALKDNFLSLKEKLDETKRAASKQSPDFAHHISNMRTNEHLKSIETELQNYLSFSQSEEILVSLKRFDDYLRYAFVSQNIRFLFMECSLPLFLGFFAIEWQLLLWINPNFLHWLKILVEILFFN